MIKFFLAALLSSSPADLEPGRELRKEGAIEEAIVFFQESLASEPDSAEAQRELGHCLVLAGRYTEAIEMYGNLGRLARSTMAVGSGQMDRTGASVSRERRSQSRAESSGSTTRRSIGRKLGRSARRAARGVRSC